MRICRLDRLVFERPRPTAIHAAPCKHCPSACDVHDPEAWEYKRAPRRVQLDCLFVCAWRPDKLCKGLCDFLSVTANDLK